MALIQSLCFWAVGFLITEFLCRPLKAAQEKKCLIASNEALEQETEEIDATYRHFRKSGIVHVVALIAGTLLPFGAARWLALIACALVLPPIFYDFFYVNIKKMGQSKGRASLALVSAINLALIVYDLSYFYFGYIQNSLGQ